MKLLSCKDTLLILILSAAILVVTPAAAEKIPNPVAEFAGLDKITGRIFRFDVYLNETLQFGALRVTPRVCNSRPPTEEPNTVGFVEVDEVTLDGEVNRIFTGWMFVASPALNAVEHGIYDVWLTDCKHRTYKKPPENYDGLPVILLEREDKSQQNNAAQENAEPVESDSEPEEIIYPLPKRKPEIRLP